MSERDDYAVLLAGHGSRDPDGIDEFMQLTELMRAQRPALAHGFLEFAEPTIGAAAQQLIDAGAKRIVMVPAVLLAAMHAKNDLPSEWQTLARDYPTASFHFAATMNLHPTLLAVCRERIVAAEAQSAETVARADTCLVVVGRGTSDPDANGDVAKLARMLQEGMGFGAVFVCYSGTAEPLVADGLQSAARLGCKRLIVLPYFLFDGVLVKRIYRAADDLAERHPELEIRKAGYLGVDSRVAEVLLERAEQGVAGDANMNCALCQYRVKIVGMEHKVGLPQRAHHLKARADSTPAEIAWPRYQPHPIEAESMRIITEGRDWSSFPPDQHLALKRLVHTTGDFTCVDEMFFSPGAAEIGMRALLRCQRVVTDVTMVETGLKRVVLKQLGVETWCGVHDEETRLMAEAHGLTRSAAGIRRAWEKFGNDVVIAIGDAPTAIMEVVRLVREHGWRPQLVVGLPVGFVGTRECKDALKKLMQVPRITNSGTRGGSPWAATVVNALMIAAIEAVYLEKQAG
ncbi:precorrin-8X methylmutase [Paludibacterium purpuratum]|uniref:Precorrin-8X methylmutase n=1 Tax=Paludibacterium purpuratum TaxID=1144873 RepID=A0A4R7B578_9NEIS|nr:precorrin-8X methylmutase [Paludibacterium purpuratum]TDR79820.1 precorrin-8X methylmutase [Paludibacterium purpuratum]